MSRFKVGDTAFLAHDITEGATGDHPAFQMGVFGEKVKIVSIGNFHCDYLVKGTTNPGKPWWCESNDLTNSKPMKFNE